MGFDQNLLETFQDQLGYTFSNLKFLHQALTTVSFSNENNGEANNEALATLGDAVAKLIITQHAIQILKIEDKGSITKYKEKYESRKVMTQSFTNYFPDTASEDSVTFQLFRLGKGERTNKQYLSNDFLGEFLETIFGAIYLDTFSDLVRTGVVVTRILKIE